MIEEHGKWIMCGHDLFEEAPLKNHAQIREYIHEVGFVPLFKNEIPGFSIEEHSYNGGWWGEDPNLDPWAFREFIAGQEDIVYGKLFGGKAGFITKEWLPIFARIRRDGYDFDSRYEDGLASHRAKMIMDTLEQHNSMPSHILKQEAGFGKGGEKGFDSTINQLQMQIYIIAAGFARKKNKQGQEYGWPGVILAMTEKVFGYDYVRSAYSMDLNEAKNKIRESAIKRYEIPSEKIMDKVLGLK
ncbi:MAG: hypothetical protein PUC65_05170 [Clostridiales bacterium]|nr:hypothetical protein [Clostridiales bacterium]